MAHSELTRPIIKAPASDDIVAPAGFGAETKSKKVEPVKKPTKQDLEQLKIKKAWEIATGPAKNIPMNLIMSYMTGNSLQMIPIMMTLMLLWNPLKSIFTETNSAFSGLKTEKNAQEILAPQAVFVLCQLANMGVGLWKLNKMGLIPNGEADWLAWKTASQVIERVTLG